MLDAQGIELAIHLHGTVQEALGLLVAHALVHLGVFLDQRVLAVWQEGAAAGGVHGHFVGIRVAFEHRDLPGREFVGILVDVFRGDGKQLVVVGEWIHQTLADLVTLGEFLDPARPRRNGTLGIAGALGAHGRQGIAAQLRRLFRGDFRQYRPGHQNRKQRASGIQFTYRHAYNSIYSMLSV